MNIINKIEQQKIRMYGSNFAKFPIGKIEINQNKQPAVKSLP